MKMNRKGNKMSKKWIGMVAVLVSVVSAHGNIIFLEEFDSSNKAYATNSATSPGNVWVDFGNRVTETDIGTAVEGYSTASGGSSSVLAGKKSVNDVQIRSDFNVGITDATQVTNISWRVRADLNNNGLYDDDAMGAAAVQFYVGTNAYGSAAANATGAGNIDMRTLAGVTATYALNPSSGWVKYNYSFAAGTLTAIRSLRFDVLDNVNGSQGQAFEVDYIKIDAIPEPGQGPRSTLFIFK
jgi:hypothetical protein